MNKTRRTSRPVVLARRPWTFTSLLLGITFVATVVFVGSASASAQGVPSVAHNPIGVARPVQSNNIDAIVYRIHAGHGAGSSLVFDTKTLYGAQYAYRTGDGVLHQNLGFNDAARYCQYGDLGHHRPGYTPEKAACKKEVTANVVKMRDSLRAALAKHDGVCFSPANRKLLVTPIEHQVRITQAVFGFGLFFGATYLGGSTTSLAAKGAIVGGAVALGTLFNSYLTVQAQAPINAAALVALNQAYNAVNDLVAALGRAGTATMRTCQAAAEALRHTQAAPGRRDIQLTNV
jgi:hypothetical protein